MARVELHATTITVPAATSNELPKSRLLPYFSLWRLLQPAGSAASSVSAPPGGPTILRSKMFVTQDLRRHMSVFSGIQCMRTHWATALSGQQVRTCLQTERGCTDFKSVFSGAPPSLYLPVRFLHSLRSTPVLLLLYRTLTYRVRV